MRRVSVNYFVAGASLSTLWVGGEFASLTLFDGVFAGSDRDQGLSWL